MEIVVYTTIFGATDPLRDPTIDLAALGIPCICFTDRDDITSPTGRWEIVKVELDCRTPTLASRLKKINAHLTFPKADCTLWLDAAYQLQMDPRQIAERWMWRCDMLAMAHPDRTNIEDEGKEIVRYGLVPEATIQAQVAHYRAQGFDTRSQKAITSTGFCLRRNTPRMARFESVWWAEVERWCWRDQMSIDYAASKVGIDVTYLPGHYRQNPYAHWQKFAPQ